MRKNIETEIGDIAAQLVRIDHQMDELKEAKTGLTKRFLTLAERHIDMEGRSRYWPVPQLGMRVRATWAEGNIPVDYDALMRSIGPDLFAEVCTVKTAELDVAKWNEVVEQERTTDSALEKCLGKSKPRVPGIYVEKISKAPGGN